jgi:hypothetical protein
MARVHTYRGMNIYRNDEPGHKVRWYTVAPSLGADTLEGIKRLIRKHVDG